MSLLYQVIEDCIDTIIKNKRERIKQIEEAEFLNKDEVTSKIYSIHQDINYLKICKFKINELLLFVQDLENTV